MHEPHSDPTAQQLKASLTACVCVCVLMRESTGLLLWSCWLEMDLEPHATAGSLASCLLPTVCMSVGDPSCFTSRQKRRTHTPTTVPMSVFSLHAHLLKRQKPPTTSSVRDLFHYQIFRASNIKGLSSEGNSTAAMHSSINSLLNMYFSDLWIKTLRDHTMMSSRIKR